MPPIYHPLPPHFYDRPTLQVAPELLGKLLVRRLDGEVVVGKIVETEAYLGVGDAAAHSAKGPTKRNRILFEEPGRAYVYQLRAYYLLNFVTEEVGTAGCVLLRALEPLQGIEYLRHSLGTSPAQDHRLMNGPGKICRALQINLTHYGTDITRENSPFYVAANDQVESEPFDIEISNRIGITKAVELPYRFTIKGNRFKSR